MTMKRFCRFLLAESSENEPLDMDKFLSYAKKDSILAKDMTEWTDECDNVAREMFHLLDRNEDGRLDSKDLIKMDKGDKLEMWIGRLMDRWTDFQELSADQWLDSLEKIPEPSRKPEDFLGNMMHDEIEKMPKYLEEMEEKRRERRRRKVEETQADQKKQGGKDEL